MAEETASWGRIRSWLDPVGRDRARAGTLGLTIYGLLLANAIVAATFRHGDPVWKVFTTLLFSMAIFWCAHVYAGTVARHASHDSASGVREALRESMAESAGMLRATVLPAVCLLLAVVGLLDADTAVRIALWAGVAALALLGILAFRDRGEPWHRALLGGATSGLFGVAIILLQAIAH